MIREEALAQVNRNLFKILGNEPTITATIAYKAINQIYDDFEEQLKSKDERIKELEEAMKPKTCDGCVHEVEDMQDIHCAFCSRSCDDNFEPKDNQ